METTTRQTQVAEDRKILLAAKWEISTQATIERRVVRERAKALGSEGVEDVEALGRRLADLYNSEMAGWKVQLSEGGETLEERKERIRTRAHMLKDQREDERKVYVKEMYDLQWRTACDDARTLDSNAVLNKLVSDRSSALNFKEGDGRLREKEEAARSAEVWKGQMAELDAKEASDVLKRRNRNIAQRETLDQQCSLLLNKKAELKERNREAESKELDNWRNDDLLEKKKQQVLLEAAYARGTATKDYNEQNVGRAAAEKVVTRRQDLLLLQYAMEKERLEIKGEWEKKQGERQQSAQYKAFLEEQMHKELEDTREVDEYRRVESDKIWVKRDAAKQDEDDARTMLMHEVDIGRREQMRLKKDKADDDRKYFEEQLALDRQDWNTQQRREDDKKAQVKAGILHNQDALKNQMAFRKQEKARIEQDKFLESKQMEHMERKHVDRVNNQRGQVQDYHPRKHTNWYT
jgi:hypothetical protein